MVYKIGLRLSILFILVLSIIGCNPITGISLNESDVELEVGETFELIAFIIPSEYAHEIWWSSEDSKIITFERIQTEEASWLITGKSIGEEEIQIGETQNGYIATCKVTVVESVSEQISVTEVSISPTTDSIVVGTTTQLVADIIPIDADNKNVTWESSNTAVATINDTGLVTGQSVGSAKITVTTEDGSYSAESTITVTSIADTSLSNLFLSDGLLSPDFSSDVYNYTSSVAYSVSSVDAFPIPTSSNSVIKINGVEEQSTVALNEGSNTIYINISDAAGVVENDYSINITRNTPVTDPSLSTVLFSDGVLSPSFDSSTFSYINQVPIDVETISFQLFGTDTNISILINSSISLSSGEVYSEFALNIGDNLLTVLVTAEDGTTQSTYNFNIRRSESDEI